MTDKMTIELDAGLVSEYARSGAIPPKLRDALADAQRKAAQRAFEARQREAAERYATNDCHLWFEVALKIARRVDGTFKVSAFGHPYYQSTVPVDGSEAIDPGDGLLDPVDAIAWVRDVALPRILQ